MLNFPLFMLGVVKENFDNENKLTLALELPLAEKDNIFKASFTMPYAGENSGFYFPPEKGDTVLAVLLSLDNCIVIGSVLNPEKGIASKLYNKNNDTKSITTSSGNKISFSDKKDDENIALNVLDKTEIKLTKDTVKLSSDKSFVTIKNDSVTVDAPEELTLKCGNAKIVLEKSGDIKISGAKLTIDGSEISINSNSKAKISGKQTEITGTTLKLSANASGEISSSGTLKISGAVVNIN